MMFDGYGLSEEDKWRQTRSVTDLAHSIGVSVEAELGHITKMGADRELRDQPLIDPSVAGDFVRATGVDIVAAAIGSVHGQQSGEAQLDFARLTELNEAVQCHLSLHGGSGMSESDVRQAIARGIVKISYFTGLSRDAVARAHEMLRAIGCAAHDTVRRDARVLPSWSAAATDPLQVNRDGIGGTGALFSFVTPNGSVDLTFRQLQFPPDDQAEAELLAESAGGKGHNAARILVGLGDQARVRSGLRVIGWASE